MKSLQEWMRQIEQAAVRSADLLWHVYFLGTLQKASHSHQLLRHLLVSHRMAAKAKSTDLSGAVMTHPVDSSVQVERSPQPSLPTTAVANLPPFLPLQYRLRTPVLVTLTVISLTSVIGYRFYNEPKLDIGKAAPQTVRAPATAQIEDTKATEEKRKAARTGSALVFKLDSTVNQQVYQSLQRTLDQITSLRQAAGVLPFTKTADLSLRTQTYLRRAEEWEWRAVLEAVEEQVVAEQSDKSLVLGWNPPSLASIKLTTPDQQQAFTELQAVRRSEVPGGFVSLTDTINRTRAAYAPVRDQLRDEIATTQSPFDLTVLDLPEPVWRDLQPKIRTVIDRMLAQGIAPGLPNTALNDAVTLQLKGSIPAEAEPTAAKLILAVLHPNLLKDEEKTKLKAEQAAKEVQPEIILVRQGEVIVNADDIISESQFAQLDYFGLSRRGVNWMGLLGLGSLVTGSVIIFWLAERQFHPGMRRRDRILMYLLTISTPVLIAVGVPYPNLPAIGLLVSSFYGSALGGTVVGLLSLLLPIGVKINWTLAISSAAGGLLSGIVAARLRSREELALLGIGVGVTQAIVYLILNLFSGSAWYAILSVAAFQGAAGLVWSIIAIGISPYLENLFDLVTITRLVELANPNRPLLKRLAAETPGTFQHTLFVATLAEAAARVLGCNVELVRAGTLYHDIGKMHDPLGFIENQMGGVNKHDVINDPWKSAVLIKKHVTEGLAMARKYRLPKAVQAFIPEHQGTMFIAYFYHQAQQQVQQDPLRSLAEADFRYDGPTPQSRETGLVMLADSCEAALRSLKEATPEQALTMINKILKARWQENQLIHSGLTRDDMDKIAKVFVQVWQQFNHQRIAYPKLMVK